MVQENSRVREVYLPLYKTHLSFFYAKIDDKMDALPLLILFMLRDGKTLEDIVEVTLLPEEFIREEIKAVKDHGYFTEDNQLSDLGKRVTTMYEIISQLSKEDYNTYYSPLTRSLVLLREDQVQALTETCLDTSAGFVRYEERKINDYVLFKCTKDIAGTILKEKDLSLQADDFFIKTKRDQMKQYLKMPFELPARLPQPDDEFGEINDKVCCELQTISYKVTTNLEGQQDEQFFYRHPISGNIVRGKPYKIKNWFDASIVIPANITMEDVTADMATCLRLSMDRNISGSWNGGVCDAYVDTMATSVKGFIPFHILSEREGQR